MNSPQIFISYRRDDSEAVTGRIYDRLTRQYEPERVLMDLDSMIPGFDFRDRIQELLQGCDIILAVVGARWSGAMKGGRVRINEDSDWVRIEIETGLKRGIPIIPVLVNGAGMPSASRLPDSLKDFAYRHALVVAGQKDFHPHVDRLIKGIDDACETRWRTQPPAAAPASAMPASPAPIIVKAPAEIPRGVAQRPEPTSARDRHLFAPGPKRILALDGGGIRAVLAIPFLERLEKALERQLGKAVRLGDYFDLVGGTSVGSILATLIALGHSAAELRSIFLAFAPKTFRRSLWRVFGLLPKFSRTDFRREIDLICGDRSLDSNDLITGLAILLKRIDTNSTWILANNPRAHFWETPSDDAYFGNKRYRLSDLVQAAISAPLYFEPTELPIVARDGTGTFIDASMGIHNNPSLLMFLMSVVRHHGLCWTTGPANLAIASIGTGTYRPEVPKAAFGKPFALAIRGLTSTIHEADAFTLSQMQLLGECPTRWTVNSELGPLVGDERPLGQPLFRFLRYDVRLEPAWIESELGLKISAADVFRARSMDDPAAIPLLYDIGSAAAEKQVRAEHWPG